MALNCPLSAQPAALISECPSLGNWTGYLPVVPERGHDRADIVGGFVARYGVPGHAVQDGAR